MAGSQGLATKVPKGWTKVRVDAHLYSDRSSGRATSRRVDLKVPRVETESLRWSQRSERLGTKSQGSDTKSEGRRLSPEGVHKWPKARHEGFQDSTGMVRD